MDYRCSMIAVVAEELQSIIDFGVKKRNRRGKRKVFDNEESYSPCPCCKK